MPEAETFLAIERTFQFDLGRLQARNHDKRGIWLTSVSSIFSLPSITKKVSSSVKKVCSSMITGSTIYTQFEDDVLL